MRLKERIAVWAIKRFSKMPLQRGRKWGRRIGNLAYKYADSIKKTTLINLRYAYPDASEQELEQLAKASILQLGQQIAEFAIAWHCEHQWLLDHIESVENESLLDVEEGRGLLLLVPHLGNWEVLGQYIQDKCGVTAMYAPPKMKAFDEMIRNARTRFGGVVVPADAKGVIKITRAVKNGATTFVLPDQVPDDKGGVYVPFYGVPALTMRLAPRLIQKTGAKVVMATALPTESGWRIVFEEPSSDIYNDDERVAAAAMNASIEKLIEHAPSCYQWEYKRYRKQPDSSLRIYG